MNERTLENHLRYVKGLSEEGIKAFMTEYNLLTDKEKSELIYEFVGKKVYKMMPVDINTFLDDPYYLGGLFTLFKIWRDLLNEVYPAPFRQQYKEVILSLNRTCLPDRIS